MIRIGLRLHRTGLLSVIAIGGLNGLVQPLGYRAVAGATEASRLQFGAQMAALGRQISYLLPLPTRPDLLAGYVQWRQFGLLPIVLAFWAVLAASGATRGDEERGLVEQWLGAGLSRPRLLGSRMVAFAGAATLAVAATCGLTWVGAAAAGSPLNPAGLVVEGIAVLVVAAACFAISTLVAQFVPSRRSAAGLAAAVILGLFLLNSLGRSLDGLARLRPLSPFYPYDRTAALIPGATFDGRGTLGVGVAALLVAATAMLFFSRRDLGAGLLRGRPRTRPTLNRPSRNPLLRQPVPAGLYEARVGLFFWVLVTALLAIFFTSLAKSLVDLVKSNPVIASLVAGQGDVGRAAISVFWFGTVTLLLAVYAITRVARWSSDDLEGRLEMLLSQPLPRWRVIIDRGLALLIGLALIAASGSLATLAGAGAQGIWLPLGPLLIATGLLLPFGLAFGAIGAAFAGRYPRAAVLALSGYAVASYFLFELGPLFRWPAWLRHLSIFDLYGTPMTTGVYWHGLWAIVGLGLAGFVTGVVTLQRRDIGS